MAATDINQKKMKGNVQQMHREGRGNSRISFSFLPLCSRAPHASRYALSVGGKNQFFKSPFLERFRKEK
jgi:hypothetical protein